jgi:CheY-like chemotaxis protein
VEASSAGPGRGSEFVITLPTLAARAEPRRHDVESATVPPCTRRILVIEDNLDAAESLQWLLGLSGHHVDIACSGEEGLNKAHACKPEVVLCDIGLPGGLDGYGVARALRSDPDLRAAYLIAMTGFGLEEDRRRAQDAGFDRHMTKPVDPDALERILAGVAKSFSGT